MSYKINNYAYTTQVRENYHEEEVVDYVDKRNQGSAATPDQIKNTVAAHAAAMNNHIHDAESEITQVYKDVYDMINQGAASTGIIKHGSLSHQIKDDITSHFGEEQYTTHDDSNVLMSLPLFITPQHVKNHLKIAHIKGTEDRKIFILGNRGDVNNIIRPGSFKKLYTQAS